MNKHYIEKPMRECLLEAFKNGAIITSDGLEPDEYIHVSGHKAYYEDGGCLGSFSATNELLESQIWTNNHKWYIVSYMTEEEKKAVKEIHASKEIILKGSMKEELKKILHL